MRNRRNVIYLQVMKLEVILVVIISEIIFIYYVIMEKEKIIETSS